MGCLGNVCDDRLPEIFLLNLTLLSIILLLTRKYQLIYQLVCCAYSKKVVDVFITHYMTFMCNLLIDWSLTTTLAIFQLYRGVVTCSWTKAHQTIVVTVKWDVPIPTNPNANIVVLANCDFYLRNRIVSNGEYSNWDRLQWRIFRLRCPRDESNRVCRCRKKRFRWLFLFFFSERVTRRVPLMKQKRFFSIL